MRELRHRYAVFVFDRDRAYGGCNDTNHWAATLGEAIEIAERYLGDPKYPNAHILDVLTQRQVWDSEGRNTMEPAAVQELPRCETARLG